MGGKLFQGVHALEKPGLSSGQLAGDCYKAALQSTGHLNEAQPCGAMKLANPVRIYGCKAKDIWVRSSQVQSQCRQGLFTEEPS